MQPCHRFSIAAGLWLVAAWPVPAMAEATWADLFPLMVNLMPMGLFVELYEFASSAFKWLLVLTLLSWLGWWVKPPVAEPHRGEPQRHKRLGASHIGQIIRNPFLMSGLTLVALVMIGVGNATIRPEYLSKRPPAGSFMSDMKALFSFGASGVPEVKKVKLQSPDGQAWPQQSGYLKLPQSPPGGTGSVKLSVTLNGDSAYFKLCPYNETFSSCPGLRHAVVLRGSSFDMDGLAPGSYRLFFVLVNDADMVGMSRPIVVPPDDHAVAEFKLNSSLVWYHDGPFQRVKRAQFDKF